MTETFSQTTILATNYYTEPILGLFVLIQVHINDNLSFNIFFKGALDKYNIYIFIFNSIEEIKLNQYRNFQLTLSMRFPVMRYFVNSIIFRVSHRLLHGVFIEVDFEK